MNFCMAKATYWLMAIFFLVSCQQGSKKSNEADRSADAAAKEEPVDLTVTGKIRYPAGFKVTVMDDKAQQKLGGGNLMNDSLHVKAGGLLPNRIYYLLVQGNSSKWTERIPFLLLPSQDSLTLMAQPYAGYDSDSKLKFRVTAKHQEQEFLNTYMDAIEEKRAALGNQVVEGGSVFGSGQMQQRVQTIEQATPLIRKTFIEKGEPLISTLYFMTQAENFRKEAALYGKIYDNMPAEIKQSTYGKEIGSRLKIITNAPQKLSLQSLGASNRQRKIFDVEDYPAATYFVLYFWASWDRVTKENVNKIKESQAEGKAQWILFSLDTRYSDWEKADTEFTIAESYLLKSDIQQALIKDWYMTELPFLVLVDRQGKVLKTAGTTEEVEEYLAQL